MPALGKLSQAEVIQWINAIPVDSEFPSKLKDQIISGIKDFAVKEEAEVGGQDLYDADADDLMEICGIKKTLAKKFLRKIAMRKGQDTEEAKKQKGINDEVQSNAANAASDKFDINITASEGKLFAIKNVTRSTTIGDLKGRFYDELGDKKGRDLYKGEIGQWRGGKDDLDKKIEIKKGGKNMDDNKTLADYGIIGGQHLPLVVSFKVSGGAESKDDTDDEDEDDDEYRPRKLRKRKHKGYLKLTSKPDCIMGYTDIDGIPRAEMPCGCAYAADTMYQFTKSFFSKNISESKAICPMPQGKYCKGNESQRLWPWALVFAIADLSDKEIAYYTNAINNRISGSKNCPHKNCGAVTSRPDDLRISRVRCNVCKQSDWCWNCCKIWRDPGLGPICGNENCMGAEIIKILANCGKVKCEWHDTQNYGDEIPATRACPKCYSPLEHVVACKHIWCICCPHQFCFNCLGEWDKECDHGKSCAYKEQKI